MVTFVVAPVVVAVAVVDDVVIVAATAVAGITKSH